MYMFIRFLLVGGVGFIIDASLTYLFIELTVAPWIARIPAILSAMTFTWLANRYFTYEVEVARSANEAVRYATVAMTMAALNYFIYLMLVRQGFWPILAVTLATAFQTLISFYAYRFLVFQQNAFSLINKSRSGGMTVTNNKSVFSTTKTWREDVGIFLCSLAVLTMVMLSLHSLDSGLSGSDEGSHFLNSYFIWSYITDAFGQNPLAYARDFYLHYPKISIGHWPPLYYVFLSSFFFVLPHAPFPFMLVNLVVSALPTLLIARVVRQALGVPWAMLAAVTYVFIPISLLNSIFLMLDQAIACICLLAALIWSAYSIRPTMRLGTAYAVITATAILIKGNGWVLGVFPLFHIALTNRWRILMNWRTYAASILALSIVGSWTVITYKISSDGFNYKWGIEYFTLAISTFLPTLYNNLGPIGSIATFLGIAASFSAKKLTHLVELGKTSLALVLTTVLFHSIVPVSLEPRYMSSAIPALAILMTIGIWWITQQKQISVPIIWMMVIILAVLFATPGLMFLNKYPPRLDLRMDVAAATTTVHPIGTVAVIDGSPGVEGAFTAEVALRDPHHKNYVIRSSQLLAKSNFMGNNYALKFKSPEEVLELLDEISCGAVVIAEGEYIRPRFPHSELLLSALKRPSSPFVLKYTFRHFRGEGQTMIYSRGEPIEIKTEAIKLINFPAKSPK